MVWVRVDLGLGVTITLRSDEPSGCREWTADEVEVADDQRVRDWPMRQEIPVPYESDLGRALARQFDLFVLNESRFERSHYRR